jgi:hypothetical protein
MEEDEPWWKWRIPSPPPSTSDSFPFHPSAVNAIDRARDVPDLQGDSNAPQVRPIPYEEWAHQHSLTPLYSQAVPTAFVTTDARPSLPYRVWAAQYADFGYPALAAPPTPAAPPVPDSEKTKSCASSTRAVPDERRNPAGATGAAPGGYVGDATPPPDGEVPPSLRQEVTANAETEHQEAQRVFLEPDDSTPPPAPRVNSPNRHPCETGHLARDYTLNPRPCTISRGAVTLGPRTTSRATTSRGSPTSSKGSPTRTRFNCGKRGHQARATTPAPEAATTDPASARAPAEPAERKTAKEKKKQRRSERGEMDGVEV